MSILPDNEPLTGKENIASVIIIIVVMLIVAWCIYDLSTAEPAPIKVIDGVHYYVWPVAATMDHSIQRETMIVVLFFSAIAFFFGLYLGKRGLKQG